MSSAVESPVAYEDVPQASIEAVLNIEKYEFSRGQILRYNPPEVRVDESTGEPAIPLVYFQGINGDAYLPTVMQALGNRDKRSVIAIRYAGKLQGSAKPITVEHEDYHDQDVIPEIDVEQADDMLAALDALRVNKVDALATSRGGLRWVLAMKKRPELFRNAYGDDVAGQDGRGYAEAHLDALRLATRQKFQRFVGESILRSATEEQWPKRSISDKRAEQQSVAWGQLHNTLAWLGRHTDITIRLGSDVQDKAFRTKNVKAMMAATGADQHIELIETNKGGHGIGTNSLAIDHALEQLREMERESAVLETSAA